MKRAHLIIHGLVQGVLFRAFVKNEAVKLGLKGVTRNLVDRTVEVVAEGPKEKLNNFIEICKKGPGTASISKVDVKFEKYKNEFEDFKIKR